MAITKQKATKELALILFWLRASKTACAEPCSGTSGLQNYELNMTSTEGANAKKRGWCHCQPLLFEKRK
ncbi:hypothetical protein [Rufibacter ruber]|uniref:hypothetical protein n=1 Tax=Rufibacter ruber TaxID=1783499 RepID=UPI000B3221D7|nr:hypothetical protein [Rufibacter ruber]